MDPYGVAGREIDDGDFALPDVKLCRACGADTKFFQAGCAGIDDDRQIGGDSSRRALLPKHGCGSEIFKGLAVDVERTHGRRA